MKERTALMKGIEGTPMPGMSASPDITNHLMDFIGGSGGTLTTATVGFTVVGPNGRGQETRVMAMIGGYGTDVSLKARGRYAIRMRAVVGDSTLNDEFTYEVK